MPHTSSARWWPRWPTRWPPATPTCATLTKLQSSSRTRSKTDMSHVSPRPRRSVLYMPGANERALEKAKTIPADALILDLEDAVAPDAKKAARERVCAAVDSYGTREVTIRVNGLDTEWHDADLRAAASAGPAAVVVPKVNSAAEVHNIERALELGGA